MSKLGKKPISIPKDTKVKVENGKLIMTGPKGSRELSLNDKIFSASISKDNNLLLKHKVAIFMDSTRVFHLKERANQAITNRVARHLTRCLRYFYQEEYRD